VIALSMHSTRGSAHIMHVMHSKGGGV
jgi:hypothetical protein